MIDANIPDPQHDPLLPHAQLLQAIIRLYAAAANGAGPGAPMLGAAARHLEQIDGQQLHAPRRQRKPVCRHLPRAFAAAAQGPLHSVAEAFAAIEPASDWVQNPNYSDAANGGTFLQNYGYVEIVGPGRPYESESLLVGFLLLGPRTLYPDHSHRAAETYHVVSGTTEWWRESEVWIKRSPGTLIVHEPGVRHAMRTGDDPLLALYCWRGDIATAARLSTPAG